jgi:hypothetical protein
VEQVEVAGMASQTEERGSVETNRAEAAEEL